MEHKGPVLRPRCIGPTGAQTQIPFNSIKRAGIVGYSAGKCNDCDDITSLCFINSETMMLLEKAYWA
jgi:hypothetical protein